MARTLLNRCCIRIEFFKCTTFGVSDTKSPSNIASRKVVPANAAVRRKVSGKPRGDAVVVKPCCGNQNSSGGPLKHLLSRRKAKTT